MSVTLSLKLTQVGWSAVWNANFTGLALDLTHVQFGSGNKAPDGTETALVDPKQSTPIAAGFSVSSTQIRMSSIFTGSQSYVIREVGVWSGDPAIAGSTLVGYWSQPVGDLAAKSSGVDFIFSHDMVLDAAVPPGSLTILADTAQSAMLAMITAHEASVNPHNQYATKAGVQAQTYTAFTTEGAAPTFTLTANPAIVAYAPGQRLRVKFGAAGNGADTLNVNGLGAKRLKQYDATGAKVSALVVENQLADVEYDGVDFVLLNALSEQVPIATESVAGKVELATALEAQVGTDTERAVTPAALRGALLSGFNSSLQDKGYIKFPNWLGGLIIQWGIAIPDASTGSIPFPIAFPTNMFAFVGNTYQGYSGQNLVVELSTGSRFDQKVALRSSTGSSLSGFAPVKYIAIGN